MVDTATSKTDAVPLATKKSAEVLHGLKTIYNRPKKTRILNRPSVMLQVDSGNEFMGVVKRYFDDNEVVVKYGKPGRSRQQPFAESHNSWSHYYWSPGLPCLAKYRLFIFQFLGIRSFRKLESKESIVDCSRMLDLRTGACECVCVCACVYASNHTDQYTREAEPR